MGTLWHETMGGVLGACDPSLEIIGHCLWFDGCAPLEVDVRPFPVRKEVGMKTKTPGSPKNDQHIKKKILRKKKGQSLVLKPCETDKGLSLVIACLPV